MLSKGSQFTALTSRIVTIIGLIAAALPANAGSKEISAVGALEAVNCNAGTIKILGITFAASNAGTAAAICRAGSPIELRYVSVKGVTSPDGPVLLTRLSNVSSGRYVPGATPVYLIGSISDARATSGDVGLSGAVISLGITDFQVGNLVEVLGTQPNLGGAILPTSVRIIESSGNKSDDATKAGPIDSGADLFSSIGSGTSVNSSIGSGASLFSSIGSGTSVNSSIGSGVSLFSSIGSGTSVNSSIGSGVSLFSSIGSGTSVNSSIGSGSSHE